MKIILLGGHGMLAQEMLWRWQDRHTVVSLARYNLDVLESADSIAEKLQKLQPDAVINCAAYTHVEFAESHEEDAFAINTLGAENVAQACGKLDLPLVYISTDYVFDGKKRTPYLESDTKHPLSIYGKSKSEGEDRVMANAKKSWIVRTSWLYSGYGPNFVVSMRNLLKTKKFVSVVDDQIGSPTWARDLADSVLEIIETPHPYGIYHCANTGETSWFSFAEEIAKLTKSKAEVRPVPSSAYPQEAERPKYSVLGTTKGPKMREWREALTEFLTKG